MSLKKNLKTAQASLEYFIIFALIGGLTILSASNFLSGARQSGRDLFFKAVDRINSTTTTTTMTWLDIINNAVAQTGSASTSTPTLLTHPVPDYYHLYGYTEYENNQVAVGAYDKFYFVIDPSQMGLYPTDFYIWINLGYSGSTYNNNISARIITVDRNGNQIGEPEQFAISGYLSISYNSNYVYIIELTENQGQALTSMDVCWGGF